MTNFSGFRSMDKLDIVIIREMSQAQSVLPAKVGLRSSYREMAKKLGVSPGTIRNRVEKMYSSGIVSGSSVYLNPSLLGLKGGAYALDVSPGSSKNHVVDRLRSMDGILFIHNFRGSLIGIQFVYENERALKQRTDLFRAVADSGKGIFSRVVFPSCTVALSDPEWLLISHLLRQTFGSYSQLGRELKISARTVRRRLSRLLAARAILSVPTLNYRAILGAVPADLLVTFQPSERTELEKRILQIVGGHMVYLGAGEDFAVYNLFLPNVTMAADLANSVSRLGGVTSARVELVDEHCDVTSRLWSYFENLRRAGSRNDERYEEITL